VSTNGVNEISKTLAKESHQEKESCFDFFHFILYVGVGSLQIVKVSIFYLYKIYIFPPQHCQIAEGLRKSGVGELSVTGMWDEKNFPFYLSFYDYHCNTGRRQSVVQIFYLHKMARMDR
jgi:hypothetical protein